MGIQKEISRKSYHTIGNKDRKKIGGATGLVFEEANVYQLSMCKGNMQIITRNSIPVFFAIKGTYYPTIQLLTEDPSFIRFKAVLDKPAYKPIVTGAAVMAPGVFKYIDESLGDFKKGDTVAVEIREMGIIGVGIALIDKSTLNADTRGSCLDMVHVVNDGIHTFKI